MKLLLDYVKKKCENVNSSFIPELPRSKTTTKVWNDFVKRKPNQNN